MNSWGRGHGARLRAGGAARGGEPNARVASGALLVEREQRGVWLNDDVVSNYKSLKSGALRYREQRVEDESTAAVEGCPRVSEWRWIY